MRFTCVSLSTIDKHLLNEVQKDSTLTMLELGSRVGLSHTPCWRRVKRLEEQGYVTRYVALLDPERIERSVNVLVNVTLRRHQENAMLRFEEAVQEVPEIVECYVVSGGTDYLLRVVAKDVAAYEDIVKHTLVHLPEVGNLNSTIALRQVKYTTAYPLESAG
ncbi:MAG: Lrp/AsnC family transcriptional regulator [Gammaproteobacteria bacterium]|nr:Lrp/AsnC family transcriptional regulator [Gammaproteobacteria bacterium]